MSEKKVLLITGAAIGIEFETAQKIGKKGYSVMPSVKLFKLMVDR